MCVEAFSPISIIGRTGPRYLGIGTQRPVSCQIWQDTSLKMNLWRKIVSNSTRAYSSYWVNAGLSRFQKKQLKERQDGHRISDDKNPRQLMIQRKRLPSLPEGFAPQCHIVSKNFLNRSCHRTKRSAGQPQTVKSIVGNGNISNTPNVAYHYGIIED